MARRLTLVDRRDLRALGKLLAVLLAIALRGAWIAALVLGAAALAGVAVRVFLTTSGLG